MFAQVLGGNPQTLGYRLRITVWPKLISVRFYIKFIYPEKATKFCKISILLLSYVIPVESKVEILQNFVAF